MTRIVVDWGTSRFRAYRFGRDGTVAQTHESDAGILGVAERDFEAALLREIGSWLGAGDELYLGGMITSRNGWVQTPYVECPATLQALAERALTRPGPRGTTLHFLPGVAARDPRPEVMRGEEIQVFGAIEAGGDATLVLPGTHSKWVRVRGGRIEGLHTFVTGELFALVTSHSIVGRLIPDPPPPFDETAFVSGVEQARSAESLGPLSDLFGARSGVLLGVFGPEQVRDRVSGLLIGHELRQALGAFAPRAELTLVGAAALTSRYEIALRRFGRHCRIGPADAVVRGFGRLVQR